MITSTSLQYQNQKPLNQSKVNILVIYLQMWKYEENVTGKNKRLLFIQTRKVLKPVLRLVQTGCKPEKGFPFPPHLVHCSASACGWRRRSSELWGGRATDRSARCWASVWTGTDCCWRPTRWAPAGRREGVQTRAIKLKTRRKPSF